MDLNLFYIFETSKTGGMAVVLKYGLNANIYYTAIMGLGRYTKRYSYEYRGEHYIIFI